MDVPGSGNPGVDARGVPVLDPTRNVLDLVEAAIKRQDDLRNQDMRHRRAMDDLIQTHGRELRAAEAARIDAIRAVDVGAVQRAAEVQADQAGALAIQTAALAETLRATVAATATQGAAALAAALDPIQKAIDDLRRAQYEAQGQKTQVVETQARGVSTGMWVGIAVSLLVLIVTMVGVVTAAYFATH